MNVTIEKVDCQLFHIPLPQVLTDSMHGEMTHFGFPFGSLGGPVSVLGDRLGIHLGPTLRAPLGQLAVGRALTIRDLSGPVFYYPGFA